MISSNKPSAEQIEQLKTDIGISAEEYKELKKKLKKLKNRDDKAYMYMLRLTSANHYKMDQMVDRKAHIMIMVNSIILSLVVGKLIGESQHTWKYTPIIFMGLISMISIIYAVLAIQPDAKHGEFGTHELEEEAGNLLFFENFLKLSEADYEETMVKMVNEKDSVHRSIIRDIYYLGTILHKKRMRLRVSLQVFMIGIVCAFLISILLRVYVA